MRKNGESVALRLRKAKAVLFLSLCLLSVMACTNHKQETDEMPADLSNIIDLADAVAGIRPVKLSEIADSISYIPLETGPGFLIGDRPDIHLSSRFIYANDKVFDWEGKFLFRIGKRGNGPGEEVGLRRIIDKGKSFYSQADKLIAYDSTGVFDGNEKMIVDMRGLDFGNAGRNVVLAVADSIIFMTTDFKTIKEYRTVEPWPEKSTMLNINRGVSFFTENNDSVLYYNYMNDTIYRVMSDYLSSRWIINLRDQKVPLKHLLGSEEKRLSAGAKLFQTEALEEWDYLKETDNKIRSFAVYETSSLLLIYWIKMKEFWQLRNETPNVYQIAYYDKRTGETVAVGGEGFIDDLGCLGHFYPMSGVNGNYMFTSYWPYELREIADKWKAKGKSIDQNLTDVLSKINDNDNPVLIKVSIRQNSLRIQSW